jgi:hypothetical protein
MVAINNKLAFVLLLSASMLQLGASFVLSSNLSRWENDTVSIDLFDDAEDRVLRILESIGSRSTGNQRLLVVRVSTLQNEPEESLAQIQGAIFGTGPAKSTISVLDQFRAMSHNQLLFEPAVGSKINSGMIDIRINATINGTSHLASTVWPTIKTEMGRQIGWWWQYMADRFLFCLPNGALDARTWAVSNIGGSVRDTTMLFVFIVIISKCKFSHLQPFRGR